MRHVRVMLQHQASEITEPNYRGSSLIMMRDAVRTRARVGRLPLSLVSHDLIAGPLVP